ncbi:MAG: glycosyltransferase [Alphaproteobacteria bacterium]|nr:glycosyltransferase [Alphaproteobacteria bacterium]
MRLLFYVPRTAESGGISGGLISGRHLWTAVGMRGHSVAVLTGAAADQTEPVAALDCGSYVQLAARDPAGAIGPLLEQVRADAVVFTTSSQIAAPIAACRAADLPVVMNFLTADLHALDVTFTSDPGFLYLANSSFLASRLTAWFGITAEVVHPIVHPVRLDPSVRQDRVLFINPVPQKGWAIAAAVMRALPRTPFIVIESWRLDAPWRAYCRGSIADIGNIDWRSAVEDMTPIWSRTRVLLMPSVWEEAWGRAGAEAVAAGIPVVASNRGGLPQAVGPGGVIVDVHAPIAEWTAAVARLMSDDQHHAAVGAAGRAHAARSEVQPDVLADRFVALVSEHVERYGNRD